MYATLSAHKQLPMSSGPPHLIFNSGGHACSHARLAVINQKDRRYKQVLPLLLVLLVILSGCDKGDSPFLFELTDEQGII